MSVKELGAKLLGHWCEGCRDDDTLSDRIRSLLRRWEPLEERGGDGTGPRGGGPRTGRGMGDCDALESAVREVVASMDGPECEFRVRVGEDGSYEWWMR